MEFVDISIEETQIRVEYPETWKKFEKPGILNCISPADKLTDYRLYTPKFRTELDFNALATRAHSANFIEEWIEKEYRDWRQYFDGKRPRLPDVSQPLTIAIVDIFNGLARDRKLSERPSQKDQQMYFTVDLQNYNLKMQYKLIYILARCMRFHDIDIQIQNMTDTPKTESLEQFYLNDVTCRARLLHNFRSRVPINSIVIKYIREVGWFERIRFILG